MDTLYLSLDTWDLSLDSSGNIALAGDPYSTAQSAANAIKTFSGECYYQTDTGVPYWPHILGKFPSLSVVKSQLVAAAMTVPGVTSAQVFITSVVDRKLSGQVQVTDANGVTTAATF